MFLMLLLCNVTPVAFTKEISASDVVGAIKVQFSHAQVKVADSKWRPSKLPNECPQLTVYGSIIEASVSSPDPHVFAAVSIYIENAYKLAMGNGKRDIFQNRCALWDKSPYALIQNKNLLIFVQGGCSDGDLFA